MYLLSMLPLLSSPTLPPVTKKEKLEVKEDAAQLTKEEILWQVKLERDLKAQNAILWKTHDDIKKHLSNTQMK